MNPEQLWETTMNPATRTILQVDLEDAVRGGRGLRHADGRRRCRRASKFIQTHARSVRNLDV